MDVDNNIDMIVDAIRDRVEKSLHSDEKYYMVGSLVTRRNNIREIMYSLIEFLIS